jgi:hypothetical protein
MRAGLGCPKRGKGSACAPGVEVIALTSVAANLIAIVGGVLVFRDSIGTGPVAIAGRTALTRGATARW